MIALPFTLAVALLAPQDGTAPAAAPAAKAQAAPAEELTVAQRVIALKKEYDDATRAFDDKYNEAKSDEERSKLLASDYPRTEKYVPRFLELAAQAKGEPAALESYLWVLQRVQDAETRDPIYAALIAGHVQSPKLADAVRPMGRYTVSVATESFLRAVIEKTPHREVKGLSTYALAGVLLGLADLCETMAGPEWNKETAKRSEVYYGKATLDELSTRDPGEITQEAEDLLEDVAKDYKELKTYAPLGLLAEGDLFEIRNLKIGQVAPEIKGFDVDGVPFNLSDYRGKVVVLDFWGFW